MTSVFISYRRADTSHAVDVLDAALVRAFGRAHVFRDVASLQAGRDYLPALQKAVAGSDAFIALVGHSWATGEGRSHVEQRDDPVRMEVAAALAQGVPVLPVLVDGATMPGVADLPMEVAKLSRLHALPLRLDHAEQDTAAVVASVRAERGRFWSRPGRRRSATTRREELQGDWMSEDGRGTVLTYKFNSDGTYLFVGTSRITRPTGWMEFESQHVGEYEVSGRDLRLTPFRATISQRDTDFPQQAFADRPQGVRNSVFTFQLTAPDVLALTTAKGETVSYRRSG